MLERTGEIALKLGVPIISALPRGLSMAVGHAMGRLIYALDRRHRRLALEQLGRVYGPEQARIIAPQVFENLGRLIMEMFNLYRLTPEEARRRVAFEGLDNLWRALDKGKGCLILTGHFGAFELMAGAFSLIHGRRINIVVRRMDYPPADRYLNRNRERCGNAAILKSHSMRRILKLLAANEFVGVLLDQNVARNEGVFVDFFGEPACTSKGLALLALHSGAPVVPAFIVYEGHARHRVHIEPALDLIRTGDRETDVVQNTALFTRVVEGWVRRHPGHWFWMHRRWKTRPIDEAAATAAPLKREPADERAA